MKEPAAKKGKDVTTIGYGMVFWRMSETVEAEEQLKQDTKHLVNNIVNKHGGAKPWSTIKGALEQWASKL